MIQRRIVVGLVLLVGLIGCGEGDDEPEASSASPNSSSASAATSSPFPYSEEPVAFEPGTYRIPRSEWSVVDFTVTFPEGWLVQYGHVYADPSDTFGFYAVVVDEIWADACEGTTSEPTEVGPGVDDLATALLQQPGPRASGPTETTLGGYPAIRIDLTVPESLDLNQCNFAGVGLQVWYSPPADKHLVLLRDGIVSIYIVDVDGRRQVFLTQVLTSTSDEELRELQAVLDSIHIEP